MPEEEKRPTTRLRMLVRIALCLIIAAGMWTAISTSRRVGELQAEYDELARKVGYLPVDEPDKVWVVAIPTGEELVWRFRIHLPADFAVSEVHYSGWISATTPRKQRSSGGSRTRSGQSEPLEYQMSVAFLKEDGRWSLHTSSYNGRGRSGVNPEIGKLLEGETPLHVEFVGRDGPQSFDVDELICLLRVRGTEPVADAETDDPLYEGVYYYLVPRDLQEEFEAAQRGRPPGQ